MLGVRGDGRIKFIKKSIVFITMGIRGHGVGGEGIKKFTIIALRIRITITCKRKIGQLTISFHFIGRLIISAVIVEAIVGASGALWWGGRWWEWWRRARV